MDGAQVPARKARNLAAERGVELNFHVADIAEWEWVEEAFDVVLGVFFHFASPSLRAEIVEGKGHSGMSALIDFVARKPA